MVGAGAGSTTAEMHCMFWLGSKLGVLTNKQDRMECRRTLCQFKHADFGKLKGATAKTKLNNAIQKMGQPHSKAILERFEKAVVALPL